MYVCMYMAGHVIGPSNTAGGVTADAASDGGHFSQRHGSAVGQRSRPGGTPPYARRGDTTAGGGGARRCQTLLVACGRAAGANDLALSKAGVLHHKDDGIFVTSVLLLTRQVSAR